jgi:hypothetical protein
LMVAFSCSLWSWTLFSPPPIVFDGCFFMFTYIHILIC